MNDDALRRLLRNSLLGRKAPEGLRARVFAKLSAAPRRPLALTLAAAAAVLLAAGLRLAWRRPAAEPVLPAAVAGALAQHLEMKDQYSRVLPMPPRELLEKIRQESGFVVDLPGLRDAGFEPREMHRCKGLGFAHVIYANSWSTLSCFLVEAGLAPLEGGTPLAGASGRVYAAGDVSAVAVRDGDLVKIWVSDLRPAQLAAIAVDAERKRESIKSMDLAVMKGAQAAVEAVIRGIPGVEFVQVEAGRGSAFVQFDERQVSSEAISALAEMNGVADAPGAEGR